MKRILILYTSIGLGHKTIAENIGFYLQQAEFEVLLKDEHKVQDGVLARWGAKIYQWLIKKAPAIWDWLHSTRWFINAILPLRTKVAAFNYKMTLSLIKDFNPDVIISTHNTSSAIVSYLKQKNLYSGSFGIAFSDYYLHPFWMFGNADFYLANVESQKEQMIKLGVEPARIFVCGITLRPKQPVDVAEVRTRLGIPVQNKVVLFASGSQGIGIDRSLIEKLRGTANVSVIVVCGKDNNTAESLIGQFAGSNISIFGFYSPMAELYAIADLFISKPGGLSAAEGLQWQLPILIFYTLPGGEPFNYKYLVEKALVMPKSENVLGTILSELETGNFKKSLEKNLQVSMLFNKQGVVIEAVNRALSTH